MAFEQLETRTSGEAAWAQAVAASGFFGADRPRPARRQPKSGAHRAQSVPAPVPTVAPELYAQPLMVTGAMLMDPRLIDDARWGNRSPASFLHVNYLRLVKDIREAGGNRVPILVRPVLDAQGLLQRYELVYGHLRLRAARELGQQVLACIQALTDTGAAARIAAENRARKSLAPIEEGMFFRRLLDDKVYTSIRRLAFELGVDAGDATRKLFLASLPKSILAAVQDPLRLTCAHARHLSALVEGDLESVAQRAKQLRAEHGPLKPKELIAALGMADMGGGVGISNTPTLKARPLLVAGKRVGFWTSEADGQLSIRLEVQLDQLQQACVLRGIEAALAA